MDFSGRQPSNITHPSFFFYIPRGNSRVKAKSLKSPLSLLFEKQWDENNKLAVWKKESSGGGSTKEDCIEFTRERDEIMKKLVCSCMRGLDSNGDKLK